MVKVDHPVSITGQTQEHPGRIRGEDAYPLEPPGHLLVLCRGDPESLGQHVAAEIQKGF